MKIYVFVFVFCFYFSRLGAVYMDNVKGSKPATCKKKLFFPKIILVRIGFHNILFTGQIWVKCRIKFHLGCITWGRNPCLLILQKIFGQGCFTVLQYECSPMEVKGSHKILGAIWAPGIGKKLVGPYFFFQGHNIFYN